MPKRYLNCFLVLMLAGILAAALIGCGTSEETADNQSASEMKPLKIGVLPVVDSLPFYIAEAEGMFKDRGIEVELVPFPSPQEISAAMQAGKIDGLVTDMIVAALLKNGGTDLKVTNVALVSTPEVRHFAVVASPNSNINSAADLKGKEVAISKNSIIEYVLDELLKENGLTPQDVKKVAIPKIPVRLQTLETDQVAAAVFPDPMAFLAEHQGAKLVMDDTKHTGISQSVLVFQQKTLDENFEAVKRLVSAYGDAGQALNNDAAKFKDLVAEKANVPAEVKDTFLCPPFPVPELPGENDVQQVMDWMVNKGLIDQAFAYDEFIEPNIVQ